MHYTFFHQQFDHQATMTIQRNGHFKTSPQEMLQNNHLYDGSQSYLSISRPYQINFQCHFEMNYYPFDVQKCTMDFALGVWTGKKNMKITL